MPVELKVLALAGLLQVVQFFLMAIPANKVLGTKVTAGPRDEPLEVGGKIGRLNRALNNHFESLILFTIATVVLVVGERTSALTAVAAWSYLVARIFYIPAYLYHIQYVRSIIWGIGFLAIIVMLVASLRPA